MALGFGNSASPLSIPAVPQLGGGGVSPSVNAAAAPLGLDKLLQSPAANAPLLPQQNAPIAAANKSAASTNPPANPLAPDNNIHPVIAQIQHPEFQNFVSSVMNGVNQSTQPGAS